VQSGADGPGLVCPEETTAAYRGGQRKVRVMVPSGAWSGARHRHAGS